MSREANTPTAAKLVHQNFIITAEEGEAESKDDDSKPMFLPARRVGSIVPSVMSVSPGFQAT